MIEDIYGKLTVNIILSGERLKAFFLRSGTWQGSLLFTTATQYCTEVLARHKKKEVKGIQIGKGEVNRVYSQMTRSYIWRPLLFLPSVFPSIRVFSDESALRLRWSKYWSFSALSDAQPVDLLLSGA